MNAEISAQVMNTLFTTYIRTLFVGTSFINPFMGTYISTLIMGAVLTYQC